MPRGPCQQDPRDIESEELPSLCLGRWRRDSSLCRELTRQCIKPGGVVDRLGHSSDEKRVLVLIGRERVHRESRISMQIGSLRRRHDEREQVVIGDERTHRMESGAAVGADSGEERQAHTVLIEQLPSRAREIWANFGEATPPQGNEASACSPAQSTPL